MDLELSSEGSRARLEGTTSEVEAASEVNEWLKEFSEYESSEVVKERSGNVESPERETVASQAPQQIGPNATLVRAELGAIVQNLHSSAAVTMKHIR